MLFSQRKGFTPVRETLQVGSLDTRTRTAVWNACYKSFFEPGANVEDDDTVWTVLNNFLPVLWEHFFASPLDQMQKYTSQNVAAIRKWLFDERTQWYRILDFVEFLCSHVPRPLARSIAMSVNDALTRESTAYRVVKGVVVEITDPAEIAEVEEALESTEGIPGAQEHIRRALQLLGDRTNPDFRNAIKEAISSVEAACQVIANDRSATLGQAIKTVERQNQIHPALRRALENLYGYTSDADGVRHAMLDIPDLTHVDAKFMVVVCCAFVNYLVARSAR